MASRFTSRVGGSPFEARHPGGEYHRTAGISGATTKAATVRDDAFHADGMSA